MSIKRSLAAAMVVATMGPRSPRITASVERMLARLSVPVLIEPAHEEITRRIYG